MTFETLTFHDKRTVDVELHPPFSALSTRTLCELAEALERVHSKPMVRGVTLRTKGLHRGAENIENAAPLFPSGGRMFERRGRRVVDLLEALRVPVIACVHGEALGGGFEILLATDFLYATKASVFGKPEIRVGVGPDLGGGSRLTRFLDDDEAKNLLYTGRTVSADTARNLGLVNRVFHSQESMHRAARHTMQRICQNCPVAIGTCKDVISSIFSEFEDPEPGPPAVVTASP